MKYPFLLLIPLAIFIQACEPLPGSTSPRVLQSPTPPLSAGSGAGADAGLVDIPVAVGRGVDGGWFQLYFTNPADPAADQLSGGVDVPLVEAIDAADLSVDAALYSLTLYDVRRALIGAHRRGVRVRVVMESDNMDGSDPQALIQAGVPLIGDRREGLMHDKFVVIDRSEVWTGSMNLTDAGTYRDRNNLLRLRSRDVAQDYEAEFEEMFLHDRFGPDVADPTPHPRVTLDGTALELYFSPEDHVQSVLLDLLKNARSSVYFLAYSFTSDPLRDAILERARAGLKVSGVVDDNQARTNTGAEYDTLRLAGIDVRLDGEPGLLHHKVMILDGEIVVMGSYNFTASAEKYNDENLIVIHSPEIAAQYMKEYRRVYKAAQP